MIRRFVIVCVIGFALPGAFADEESVVEIQLDSSAELPIGGESAEHTPWTLVAPVCKIQELLTDCREDCTEACGDARLVMWREGECGFCTCLCFH